ncbi:MAG: helix-turn-helix transcriptional regulator [Clostridia bacterium]|nr:helix-turn-helix transcriptional regulator [Clostridia bacterium]
MEKAFDDFFILIKRIVVAHKFTYDENTTCNYSDGRKYYGFVYLLSGNLNYNFNNGKEMQAVAGDIVFLKPNDAYIVSCSEVCHHYTVNFQIEESASEGSIVEKILNKLDTVHLYRTSGANFYGDNLGKLCEYWFKKKEGYRMQSLSLLYKILYTFVQNQLYLTYDNNFNKIQPAKEYLETHWDKETSLKELANLCCLSVAHFRHLFMKILNTTPMRYRNSLRILYAKDYLLQNEYSITEIANKCGFDDGNYFNRYFKKHTGVTPGQYRRQ